MIVFCDLDGVVCDLHAEWLRRYNVDYDDSLTLDSLASWDMTAAVKPACGVKIFEYLHHPDLYACVPEVPGAREGVESLRAAGHRVVFATAANVRQAGNKLLWLERHGFLTLTHGTLSKDYVGVQDKSLLRGDCLIDDGVHNLERFSGLRLLFDQPHNRAVSGYRRVTWPDVPHALESHVR